MRENDTSEIVISKMYLDEIGWKEGNILDIQVVNNSIILTKKNSWDDVEEAQENIELILDDIVKNGTIHVIEHKGKKYVMSPYNEELENIKKEWIEKEFKSGGKDG